MATRMQQRRGTAAQWISTNNGNGPILAAGEIGYESDSNKFKIGDGVNHWVDLAYFLDVDSLGGSLDDYVPLTDLGQPDGVATLDGSGKLVASQIPSIDEISQDAINSALTAGSGIAKNYDDAANILTISNTGVVSLEGTAGEIVVDQSSGEVVIGLAQDVEIAGTLTLSQSPNTDLEAATKLYVDNVTSGINFHEAVKAATVDTLAAAYSNGTAGVGATLTNSGTQAALVIDGVTLVSDDRVLVKDQTDAKQNGVYFVTAAGSGSSNWILTRASDADNSPAGEFKPGDFHLVIDGTVNSGFGFVNTSTEPIVVGTTNIAYTAFSAGKTVTAGAGLWETSPGVIAIDDTVATIADAQTLTNKGINLANNTVTTTIAQLNTAVTDANLATIAGTETLVNKTLAEPTVEAGNITGATITGGSVDVPSLSLNGATVATASELSTHASDTTNVHGIADTSLLATTEYVDSSISAFDALPGQATNDGKFLQTDGTSASWQLVDLTAKQDVITAGDGLVLTGANLDVDVATYGGVYIDIDGKLAADEYYVTFNAAEQNLTNKTLTSPKINEDVVLTATATELNLLDGVTGTLATTAGAETLSSKTLNNPAVVVNISTNEYTIDSELAYLDGVTSSIQDQIDDKSPSESPTFTGTLNAADVVIAGDLTVQGTTTTVSAENLEINDPLIYIGTGNSANANDLGVVGHFDDGTYQHTGIVRDATDGKWKIFSGVTTEPGTTIDFTGATYDTLKVGTLEGSAALTGTPTAPTAEALTNTTQIATTAYVQEDNKVAYVSVSDTSLTVAQSTHMFKTVHCTSSSAVTVSIPTDASDNWPIGTYVNIRQMGTGQITVVAATPATTTVVATDSQFKSRVRYSEIVLEKIAANSWIVVGDTAA